MCFKIPQRLRQIFCTNMLSIVLYRPGTYLPQFGNTIPGVVPTASLGPSYMSVQDYNGESR